VKFRRRIQNNFIAVFKPEQDMGPAVYGTAYLHLSAHRPFSLHHPDISPHQGIRGNQNGGFLLTHEDIHIDLGTDLQRRPQLHGNMQQIALSRRG
jgi:hypothetical protein